MKNLPRIYLQRLILFFAVSLLIIISSRLPLALAQDPSPGATPTTPVPYLDEAIFDQMSGAAQTLLELKYGKQKSVSAAELEGKDSQPSPALPSLPRPNIPISSQAVINNVLVNDPSADATEQDTQSETALVLAGSTLIAAWNDSGSIISGSHFTGFGRSTNGGINWSDGGILPANPDGDGGDPVLAHDNTLSRTYLVTLVIDPSTVSGLRVFRSDNAASSWLAPVEGAPGFGGGNFLDKPWLAVDNFPGPGNGNVYLMFRNFALGGIRPDGMYLTRSTDGGGTFGPSGGTTIIGSASVQGASVVVGPDHSVYTFWYDQSFSPRQIRMRRSTNQGVSFGAPVTVASLLGTGSNGALSLNGGFRSNSFVQVAVNPVSGHLYAVFNDDANGTDKADIFFTHSTNQGATWSAPVRVNNDATLNDQFFPAMAVTPNGTRLAVTFYDRRLDPANNLIDRFGVIGTISGGNVTFGPNFLITTSAFPVVIGQDSAVNSTYMGDYDMMAADNNFFFTTWGDNRDPSIAEPARNNSNIRFGRIPVTGPGPILQLVSATLAPGCGNGNGAIDVNECNKLNIVLRNLGSSTVTGVSAVLSSSTPEVSVTQANTPYTDIASGTTATNTIHLKFKTSASFVAGTLLNFNLAVNTANAGVFNFPFQMPSGSIGAPIRFNNNTPLAIADLNTVTSTIAVSGIPAAVGKVTVSLHLTHTFNADLDIFLVGPDGTTVELTTDNGGSGDNYGTACSPDGSRTTFDDSAATLITAGTAPFVGTFHPEGSLATFSNKSGAAVNGPWSLRITDDLGGDFGRLQCWSLFISPFSAVDVGEAGCIESTFLPVIVKQN